jgi:adenylate kinase
MKRRVILLGPPGSGKGTIARELETQTGLKHFSSGKILRREVSQETQTGRYVKRLLEQGEFVPDEVVFGVMESRLDGVVLEHGFILDGFPRNLEQARRLDQWLESKGRPLETVLLLKCSEGVLLERLTERRICPNCGKIYHLRAMPPGNAGRCDICGENLERREDDSIAVARHRLEIYEQKTEPLIRFYEGEKKLHEIDSNQPVERVARAASEILLR